MGRRWTEPVPGRLKLWSVDACERESACLLIWRGEDPGRAPAIQAVPYRCHGWRCRRCAWGVAREDFRRIRAGATARRWWTYLVLTFDPADHASPWDAYKAAGSTWDKGLRRRLERRFGRLEYIQTWERHLSGRPHVNVLLRSDGLEEHVKGLPHEHRLVRLKHRPGEGRMAHWTAWRKELQPLARESGFGLRTWVEIVDSADSVASYLAKIAHEFASSAFKAGDQRPLGAPPHFRRVRSSRELLPPRERIRTLREVDPETGETTERLERVPLDAESTMSGVLSPKPLSTFDVETAEHARKLLEAGHTPEAVALLLDLEEPELEPILRARAPHALDVDDAWLYQERARWRRRENDRRDTYE